MHHLSYFISLKWIITTSWHMYTFSVFYFFFLQVWFVYADLMPQVFSLYLPFCVFPTTKTEWVITVYRISFWMKRMNKAKSHAVRPHFFCSSHPNMQQTCLLMFNSQIYGYFFPWDLVTSHFIYLYLAMVLQYLESTLHTLVAATSDKPRTSFQVVRNNLC